MQTFRSRLIPARLAAPLLGLCAVLALPGVLPALSCPRISMAYYTSWSRWTYPSSAIPYDKLTHICHAFLQENSDGSLTVPADLLDANLIAQAHAHGVKVLISVGGASWSGAFPALAASAAYRANFAAQLESFCRTNGYDGVDIDWEFPDNAAKSANFDALIQDIRAKFNSSPAPAPSWLITSAVSGDLYYAGFLHLGTLKNSMSYFNVMTYDYHGPWTNHSGHNAGLYPSSMEWGGHGQADQRDSINYFLGQGVPAGQINMGLPFYGYNFPTATLYGGCGCGGTTSLAYSAIAPLIGAGWTYHFDASAQSPYLTNGSNTITYDDANSIGIKADWALNTANIAGVFMWALDNDNLGGGNQPLLAAMSAKAFACSTPTFTATPTIVLTATPTPTPVVAATWRVNAGGPAYTDGLGRTWSADTRFYGGTAASTTQAVAGADPTLFKSERYGTAFSYTFYVPPGSYQLTLRFAEIYYNTTGSRLFNVAINGSPVLSAFDIVAAAGAAFTPVDRVFDNIAPSGGVITVAFSVGGADLPKVSALQVIPEPSPTATVTPTRTASRAPTASPSRTASPASSASPSPTLSASAAPSASPTETASAAPSRSPTAALGSPTATATATAVLSATTSGTVTPTASPSPAFSPTATLSPSPTASATASVTAASSAAATATVSLTGTPSPTPTASPTSGATPPLPSGTPTGTATPIPWEPSASPSGTAAATGTPTSTRTAVPADTATATPSATRSPTFAATPSPRPVNEDGSLQVLEQRVWPNPRPRYLSLRLSGPATRVRLRLWSASMALAAEIEGAPRQGGWSRVELPAATLTALPPGTYFYTVEAWSARAKAGSVAPGRVVILH